MSSLLLIVKEGMRPVRAGSSQTTVSFIYAIHCNGQHRLAALIVKTAPRIQLDGLLGNEWIARCEKPVAADIAPELDPIVNILKLSAQGRLP